MNTLIKYKKNKLFFELLTLTTQIQTLSTRVHVCSI